MVITLADWQFSVDREQTLAYTMKCAGDHCLCAYCRNYYANVDAAHPSLRPFLERFGVCIEGPGEVMPVEPTWIVACYRVTGQILHQGTARMHVDGVPIRPEVSDNGTFLFWVGEMELPWTQDEPMEDVISPANDPEFMDRMMQLLLLWAEDDSLKN